MRPRQTFRGLNMAASITAPDNRRPARDPHGLISMSSKQTVKENAHPG